RPPPSSTPVPYTTLFRSRWSAPPKFARLRPEGGAGQEAGGPPVRTFGPEVGRMSSTRSPFLKWAGGKRHLVPFIAETLGLLPGEDRKSTRLNSSHVKISY